jgi:hypothetical protein
VIAKDGQPIGRRFIEDFTDTLPDLLLVQRDVAGNLTAALPPGAKVFAEVAPVGAPESALRFELFYNAPARAFSGFFYQSELSGDARCTLTISVLDSAGQRIGMSETVTYNRLAGDLSIPAFAPGNELPHVSLRGIVNETLSVSIKDTVRLQAQGTDAHQGFFVKWEWSVGDGPFQQRSGADTLFIAPDSGDSRITVRVRATDGNGLQAVDSVAVSVFQDRPELGVLPVEAQERREIYEYSPRRNLDLVASLAQSFGRIVRWEISFDSGATYTGTTRDSATGIVAGPMGWQLYPRAVCVLRATDDDGNEVSDTLRFKVDIVPPTPAIKDTAEDYFSLIGDEPWAKSGKSYSAVLHPDWVPANAPIRKREWSLDSGRTYFASTPVDSVLTVPVPANASLPFLVYAKLTDKAGFSATTIREVHPVQTLKYDPTDTATWKILKGNWSVAGFTGCTAGDTLTPCLGDQGLIRTRLQPREFTTRFHGWPPVPGDHFQDSNHWTTIGFAFDIQENGDFLAWTVGGTQTLLRQVRGGVVDTLASWDMGWGLKWSDHYPDPRIKVTADSIYFVNHQDNFLGRTFSAKLPDRPKAGYFGVMAGYGGISLDSVSIAVDK